MLKYTLYIRPSISPLP